MTSPEISLGSTDLVSRVSPRYVITFTQINLEMTLMCNRVGGCNPPTSAVGVFVHNVFNLTFTFVDSFRL